MGDIDHKKVEAAVMEQTRHRIAKFDSCRWEAMSTFVISTVQVANDMRQILAHCAAMEVMPKPARETLAHMEYLIRKQCKMQLGVDLVEKDAKLGRERL